MISSNGIPVEFGNEDGVHVALSGLGAGAMNSQTGQVWYGGPAANLEITAVPVLYSGGSGASVTLLTFCGADAATDSAAPFAFTPNCGKAKWVTSADDGDTPEFNIAGAVVETLNVDAFYLDYQAPSAPTFYPNPNDREGGWVNATVDFLGKQGSKNKDGWLMYNEDGANAGVGGYTAALRAAAAPSGGDGLEEAVAAPLLTLATLSGESKANAYCVVASAVDALGNESALPDPDDDECMTAADILATGMEAVEADMDANPPVEAMDAVPVTQMSAMRAGVDLTPPTAVFTGASLGEDAKSLNELTGGETTARQYQLHVTDNRGLRVAEPVVDTLEIRDDDGDIDGVAARTELEAEGSPLVNVQFAEDGVGYYTYTGQAQDMAGNLSEPVSRVALHDTSVPVSALIFARGKDAFNYDKTLVAADNLSIRDYSVVIEGPNDLPAPVRLKRAMIDGYNGDLTQTKTVSGPVELPFIAVSTSTNGSVAEGAVITAFTAHVTDQAGNASLGRESVAITVDTNDGGDGDVDSDEGTVVGEYALTVEDDDGAITADNTVAKSDETITLTVTATLAIGTTANPFADVHFFAEVTGINTELASETTDPRSELRQIGTVDGINAELKTGIERVWTFETEISADDYYAIVGGATSSNEIHALGVNGNGVAHALSFTPALVIGKR